MTTIELEHLAEQIISITRAKPGEFFKYETLARRLKVERLEVDEAMTQVVAWGYRVRRRRREAVAFLEPPDLLTASEIGYKLKTKLIGRNAQCYGIVQSTNDLAAQAAEASAPEGTIITAEQQTQGRGRFGRTWYSPYGTGIYVSIVLRPSFTPDRAPGISIMTALALTETLLPYFPDDVRIKWPNDVLVSGRKVAGILTELSAEGNHINHIIVGVGINANQKAGDFPPELRESATSLRRVLKRKVNRAELLRAFLQHLERDYLAYNKSGLKPAHARLKRYSALIGEHITLHSGPHVIEGKAVDFDPNGALILETHGHRLTISAGEVSVAKE